MLSVGLFSHTEIRAWAKLRVRCLSNWVTQVPLNFKQYKSFDSKSFRIAAFSTPSIAQPKMSSLEETSLHHYILTYVVPLELASLIASHLSVSLPWPKPWSQVSISPFHSWWLAVWWAQPDKSRSSLGLKFSFWELPSHKASLGWSVISLAKTERVYINKLFSRGWKIFVFLPWLWEYPFHCTRANIFTNLFNKSFYLEEKKFLYNVNHYSSRNQFISKNRRPSLLGKFQRT